MPRNLPDFPNLQHLKKQAKVLFRDLQQHDPGVTLTQAQHALARDYGFASWPKLKAHVESLPHLTSPSPEAVASVPASGGGKGGSTTSGLVPPQDDPGGGSRSLFPRFTEKARQTIFFSRYFAEHGTSRIEAVDLLLGVIQADLDLMDRLLPNIRELVERRRTTRERIPAGAGERLSIECRRILERAASKADHLRHEKISTGHFLLGFLDDDVSRTTPILADILAENGVGLDKARGQIAGALREESL